MNRLALDPGEVYRVVKGADDAVVSAWSKVKRGTVPRCRRRVNIPLRKAVLDVVEGRINKDTRVIPSARLDADGFVDEGVLREVLICDGDSYDAGQLKLLESVLEGTYYAC